MAAGDKLRISVSGAARTGKTTLASLLAKQLGIPLIPEVARELSELGHKLGQSASIATQELIAVKQNQRQANVASFVSDRSLVDVAGYCAVLAERADAGEKLGFLSVMEGSFRQFLAEPPSHVLIPEERFLVPSSTDEESFQRRVHARITGLAQQAACHLLVVTGCLENRCDEAIRWIRGAKFP